MKSRKNLFIALLAGIVFLSLTNPWIPPVNADEYIVMKDISSVNVFFDFRDGIPEYAASHLELIFETYQQLASMGKKPAFVVVFMGGSVKLISNNRSGFNAEAVKHLNGMDEVISKMSKAGIAMEVCLAAVEYFRVDPASIPSEIKPVGNGWISEIGFQSKGYALVPVF